MQFINLAGHDMAYKRSGQPQGETMVCVHGITTYSFVWQDVIPYFEQDYNVICIDLLGCGASDMPLDVSYSIQAHAERLHDFLCALNILKLHLLGHDLGGGIAQIFAIQHEPMLKTLTLINTVGYDYWPVQPITALRTPIIRQLLMGALDLGMFKLIIHQGVFHRHKITHALIEQFWQPLRTKEGRKAFMHFARCLDNQDLMMMVEKLKQLSVPTIIFRGDSDPFLTATIAERLHADIANSQLHRIQTASHFLMIDEPEWLAKHWLAGVRSQA